MACHDFSWQKFQPNKALITTWARTIIWGIRSGEPELVQEGGWMHDDQCYFGGGMHDAVMEGGQTVISAGIIMSLARHAELV